MQSGTRIERGCPLLNPLRHVHRTRLHVFQAIASIDMLKDMLVNAIPEVLDVLCGHELGRLP